MKKLKPSELVKNPDGSIYHLKLHKGQVAETIVLVGDPARVQAFSKYFDKIEYMIQNREIVTHTGWVGSKRLTIMSTGMGTDNIDIVLNELDALFNINLTTGEEIERKTVLNFIRVGTTGSLQPEIPVNSFIRSDYTIGIDNLMNFYQMHEERFVPDLAEAFVEQCQWPHVLGKPYAVRCSHILADHFRDTTIGGLTLTAPGFYGPQGRYIRLPLALQDMIDRITGFRYQDLKITNFEMETSALYGLSSLMGHHALTICLAIANRPLGQFNENYKETMNSLIQLVIEKLTQ